MLTIDKYPIKITYDQIVKWAMKLDKEKKIKLLKKLKQLVKEEGKTS